MPIFEFICQSCGHPFEELLRSASDTDGVICPICHGQDVKKKLSIFAPKISGGSGTYSFSPAASSCSSGSA